MDSLAQTRRTIIPLVIVLVVVSLAGVGWWLGWRFVGDGQTGLEKLTGQPQTTPEVVTELGPIQSDCLNLPPGVDPKVGASSYFLNQGDNSLDTFVYSGLVKEVSSKTINQGETSCRYYKIDILKGQNIRFFYLPDNLVSIPADPSQSISRIESSET